jgi:hypothetical protein
MAGYCEHGSELSESIKGEEFLDQLSDYQLLKKQFARFKLRNSKSVCPMVAQAVWTCSSVWN